MTRPTRFPLRRIWHAAAGLALAAAVAACSTQPQNYAQTRSEAPAAAPMAASPQVQSTLGTQWGEGRESRVRTVQAARVTPDRPADVQQLRYSDEASIRQALGPRADQQLSVLLARGDVEMRVTGDSGQALRIYSDQAANYQLAGYSGMRYEMHFKNHSNRVYEVVATVDGLDVMSGQPGSLRNTGYLVRPGDKITIAGFRRSNQEVAAFRFSGKGNAYAANTPAGDSRNIGVIGVALFETRLDQPASSDTPRRPQGDAPNAFPADGGPYAQPPQYRR